jgi:uncharacterized membrane protein YphA (DoxX/SURF4 family)
MLYQRYFLRMNQSNMTHVLGLLAGLALALALLLIVKLSYTGKQPLFNMLQRPENLSLAVTLLTCIVVYAGNKSRPRDPARVLRGKLRQRHPRLCFGFCFLLPSDRSSSVPLVIFTFPGIVSAYRLANEHLDTRTRVSANAPSPVFRATLFIHLFIAGESVFSKDESHRKQNNLL